MAGRPVREGDWPLGTGTPLDPELVPYLDYQLYFPDDTPACNRTECPDQWCQSGPRELGNARRMSLRELLAVIRKHEQEAEAS